MPEEYSKTEERLNVLSHGLASVASIAGMIVLVVLASMEANAWKIVSFSVFGISMTLLFVFSTLYHSVKGERARQVFKMLDHCAIFLLIAGTYTPFLLVNMRGTTGWIMFGTIWGLALLGIILKLGFGHRLKALQMAIYLGMGWLIVLASRELVETVSTLGVWLVVAGGLTYTLGIVFYLIKQIPFNHAIWHLFVVGGSTCHFFAIYHGVLYGQVSG
ncbi:hemolysin III family protein [Marinobacter sp.]|uniref:PAQR family membrane homeostasis protein TrhA n=1 Tax=Marinobacter sp. TaxID=50741 RepID=UPI00384A63C6